jgi:hypothetical protein
VAKSISPVTRTTVPLPLRSTANEKFSVSMSASGVLVRETMHGPL